MSGSRPRCDTSGWSSWLSCNNCSPAFDELRLTIATLNQNILALKAENQELNQARKTPRNSSVPPSTTHPHAKPKSSRLPTGKAPGGQPGHPKHARALVPVEQCDKLSNSFPKSADDAVSRWISINASSIRYGIRCGRSPSTSRCSLSIPANGCSVKSAKKPRLGRCPLMFRPRPQEPSCSPQRRCF